VHTIPGTVELFVDIRGVHRDGKARLVTDFKAAMQSRCSARGLKLNFETSVDENPVPCASWIVEGLEHMCRDTGVDALVMPSGAGHDSQHVAAATDVGMLFIPSARGIAHTPDEYTSAEDVAYGAEVLTEALRRLANDELH